jgi:hypothetical protein
METDEDFYTDLIESLKARDTNKANSVVMVELGKAIGNDKDGFITVLTNADIEVDEDASDIELVNEFVKNADENDELLLGASLFVNHNKKVLNADGTEGVSDVGVKACHKVMSSYFCGSYSNAQGIDPVSVVASSIADLGKSAATITSGAQNLKMQRKYGAQMSFDKQREAKNQLMQGIVASKQQAMDAKTKEKEAKSKNIRTALLVGGGIVAVLGIVGLVIYLKKRKK